jgi:hypothetical protein
MKNKEENTGQSGNKFLSTNSIQLFHINSKPQEQQSELK